jgi:hypothetical protein
LDVPVFDHDEPTAIRRAHIGVREALARSSQHIVEADVDRMFIGYVEAVMWVRGLDELFTRSDHDYQARRDLDPGGQVVSALCWARDKGIHQLVALHDKADPSESDLGVGPTYPDGSFPVWLKSSEAMLRDSTTFRGDGTKVAAYDCHLAGRSLLATLAKARDFLWLRAMPVAPETPSIF